jgi:hypothetical protein
MGLGKKIKQYIEGNLSMLEEDLFGKPLYYKEQILYRASKCQDCYRLGKCLNCGCSLPGKHYVKESCNDGLRFPDLMDEQSWKAYKEENGIQIDIHND